jgi:nucleoside 2-deoxyribosyltransferase
MPRGSIYLAGPIHGANRIDVNTWRRQASKALLVENDFATVNPAVRVINDSNTKEVIAADMTDIQRCSGVLAFLPNKYLCRGTTMEIFYAKFVLGKPVVVFGETNWSAWVWNFADECFPQLGDALAYIKQNNSTFSFAGC